MRALPVFLLILSIALNSCTRTIYVPYMPDKVNSPGLGEKQQLKLDVSASTFASLSADAAYSPINHLVIVGSFRQYRFLEDGESTVNGTVVGKSSNTIKGHRVDLGLGYFFPFGKGRFEVIGGAGVGRLKGNAYELDYNPYLLEQYDYRMNLVRGFLQTGVGFEGKIFSLMGGLKICGQRYSDFRYTSYSWPDPLIVADGPVHVQPYLDLRLGYKFVKFTTQMGFSYSGLSILNGDRNAPVTLGLFPWPYISAGLIFDFVTSSPHSELH